MNYLQGTAGSVRFVRVCRCSWLFARVRRLQSHIVQAHKHVYLLPLTAMSAVVWHHKLLLLSHMHQLSLQARIVDKCMASGRILTDVC